MQNNKDNSKGFTAKIDISAFIYFCKCCWAKSIKVAFDCLDKISPNPFNFQKSFLLWCIQQNNTHPDVVLFISRRTLFVFAHERWWRIFFFLSQSQSISYILYLSVCTAFVSQHHLLSPEQDTLMPAWISSEKGAAVTEARLVNGQTAVQHLAPTSHTEVFKRQRKDKKIQNQFLTKKDV